MKTELIRPKKERKNLNQNTSNESQNIIVSVIILVLGIILITNSNSIITTLLIIIGAVIALYGIYTAFQYLNYKKNLGMENPALLTTAMVCITLGILTIFLSNILEVGFRVIIGIGLVSYSFKNFNLYTISTISRSYFLIKAIIFLILGIYTIFFQNIAFVFVGIILVINSIYEIFLYFKKN